MADGDHYASYASVQAILNNAGLGTAGNGLYTDTAIEEALDGTQAMINDEMGLDTVTSIASPATWVARLRMIQIDLLRMMILGARHLKENNLSSAGDVVGFWSITPSFTNRHLGTLHRYRRQLGNRKVAYAIDMFGRGSK